MASKDSSQPQITLPVTDTELRHRTLEELFPPMEDSCVVSVACHPANYSASRIAHAVEDCDAHLLNLNVTSEWLPGGEVVVDLRVGHRSPMSVARSLERYGYPVVGVSDINDADVDTMRDRVNELMRLIDT